MKNIFITGGTFFMSILTIILIIATAWIIYHFVKAYSSKIFNSEKLLRRIAYGKSIGLFALIVGFLGQMVGLNAMFSAVAGISNGESVNSALVFGGIRVTMICPTYGVCIYLFTFAFWFVSTIMIEKRVEKLNITK